MITIIRQLILASIFIATLFYFRADLSKVKDFIVEFISTHNTEETTETILTDIKNAILAPPPLRHEGNNASDSLVPSKIVAFTNQERITASLSALAVNAELTVAAQAKVDDMIKRQYFEHVSPTGEGPSHLAKEANYEYLVIGENLALGNFENEKALVQAWMDSPGHRANILHNRFTEIGVAVGKGTFEGKTTWFAVQEFGVPLSSCPSPSTTLHNRIENLKVEVAKLGQDLDRRKKEIDSMSQSDSSYNEKANDYNAKVREYNNTLATLKGLIDQYNSQVRAFNECASG
jgi:uncharacterized protein YkwD